MSHILIDTYTTAPRRSTRLKYDYKDDYFDLDDFVEDDDGAGYAPKKPAYAMDRKSNGIVLILLSTIWWNVACG